MLEYNDPLKVVCVKTGGSKKLIKGAIYLAISLRTNNWQNITPKKRSISLKYGGTYSSDFFTINGENFDNKPDFNMVNRKVLSATTDYTGQYVRCLHDSGKTLKAGEIYYVGEQATRILIDWNKRPYNVVKLKIRGMRNWTSLYNFEEIPISEQRFIKLKALKGEKIKTGDETRKFLHYTEKEKVLILLQILTSAILDINSAELTEKINICSIILNKGKQYNIILEDITPFIKQLEIILKPYDLIWD